MSPGCPVQGNFELYQDVHVLPEAIVLRGLFDYSVTMEMQCLASLLSF